MFRSASPYPKVDPCEHRPLSFAYIEPNQPRDSQSPLLCTLHGYGGDDGGLTDHALRWAGENGAFVILAHSTAATWDVLQGGYGADVANLDAAMAWALRAWPVDRSRTILAGFSDGASYALTLGLKNGDIFSRVVACSPGFAMIADACGRPSIFLAHGASDAVLPVTCSQGIAQRLKKHGYDIIYEEFDGGHHVPHDALDRALTTLATYPR